MDELINKLKSEIIEVLKLEDIEHDDIDAEAPLFQEGLGLDSIDALELIVLLEKNYGLRIEDSKDGRKVFFSVKSLAEYIRLHNKG